SWSGSPRRGSNAERRSAADARNADPTVVDTDDWRNANRITCPTLGSPPNRSEPGAENASAEYAVDSPVACIQALLNPATPLTSGTVMSHVAGTAPRYDAVATITTNLLDGPDPCRKTNLAAVG